MFLLSAYQKNNVYAVGFYNLENLFDTCHDAGKNDYEYLPDGRNRWNGLKYSHKLKNMARVLSRVVPLLVTYKNHLRYFEESEIIFIFAVKTRI